MEPVILIVGFILNILLFIGAIFGAYNKMDKRVTVLETESKTKIDESQLLKKVDDMRKEISEKIDEIAKKFDRNVERLWDAWKEAEKK